MKPKILFIMIAIFFTAGWSLKNADAHKVVVFAWVEDGQIHVEGGFGSKKKAMNSPVEVVDTEGRIVHQGKTDDNGEFKFPVPQNITSDLTIWLEAGKGHKGKWILKKEELVPGVAEDLDTIEKERYERLEKGPSVLKIIAGIAVIFAMALILKQMKRIKKQND